MKLSWISFYLVYIAYSGIYKVFSSASFSHSDHSFGLRRKKKKKNLLCRSRALVIFQLGSRLA